MSAKRLKLNPKLSKGVEAFCLAPIDQPKIDWQSLHNMQKFAYGEFNFIPDPKLPDDLLIKINKKSPNEHIAANIWKWVNHASRLQYRAFVKEDRPFNRLLCIPLSSIMGNRILVSDDVLTAFQALSVAASKLSLRLVLYIDFEVNEKDVPSLFAIFKEINKYRTTNVGLYRFVEKGFEYTNLTYLTPLLTDIDQLHICIDMGIRCCPHYTLLFDEGSKISQIQESRVYKSWVRECWRTSWPVLWADNDCTKYASKLVKLGHTVFI